jgi:hypothetical protein
MRAERLLTKLMPTVVLDNGQNIKIVPYWQDKEMYDAISGVVQNSESYVKIETDKFKFPNNLLRRIEASASFDQLHKQFDSGIISNVYQMAKERDSDIVFLNGIRGYGYLEISAHFYKTSK